MEKIKITVEQEKALNEWKEEGWGFEQFIKSPFRGYWTDELKSLNDVKPHEFYLMHNGWYEVEQPFKVGDWVFDRELGDYSKIIEIHADKIIFQGEDEDYIENFGDYEVITESWKITMLELGREKPEFHLGDLLEGDGYVFRFDGEMSGEFEQFLKDKSFMFHPVENSIKVQIND